MQDDISILVVDDEPVVLQSCERVLKGEGYTVRGVSSGREAMETMGKAAYDLAFVDLKMPEMDGISLIGWMKNSMPGTEIGVITGYPSQDTIKEALDLGCFDYLPKPFTPVMLTDMTLKGVQRIRGKEPVEDEELSPESMAILDKAIEGLAGTPGNLIPLLQMAQEEVGYLPPAVQRHIAKRLLIPSAAVHSVVSFYSFFTMKPRGKNLIRVCLGTACYVKKIEAVLEKFKTELNIDVGGITKDKNFSMETVRCIGACGLAPVVMVNQDVHGAMQPKKVAGVLDTYK